MNAGTGHAPEKRHAAGYAVEKPPPRSRTTVPAAARGRAARRDRLEARGRFVREAELRAAERAALRREGRARRAGRAFGAAVGARDERDRPATGDASCAPTASGGATHVTRALLEAPTHERIRRFQGS